MLRKKNRIEIKTAEEIELMRRAGALGAKTLRFALDLAKPGISTGEIDKKTEEFIRDHNAIPAPLNYRGFPKSICTSVNDVICHGIPSYKQILKEGDIINIDVTVILDGFHGDTSATIAIGEVSPLAKKLMTVTLECLRLGIKEVAPGKYTGDIGRAIESYANQNGFSVVRDYTGHGLGRNFHENPLIRHFATEKRGYKMLEGMTFTIEPMINVGSFRTKTLKDGWTAVTVDGKLSAQYEHSLAVTKDGCEILTLLEGADTDAPGGYIPPAP